MSSSLSTPDSSVQPSSSASRTQTQTQKVQPWRAIWPAERESQPQAQIFGFKKGETMVFDGNAGNFFAREGWVVEQESDERREEKQ